MSEKCRHKPADISIAIRSADLQEGIQGLVSGESRPGMPFALGPNSGRRRLAADVGSFAARSNDEVIQ